MSLPTTDGWVVEAREAPAALAEGYEAPRYPMTAEQVAAEYTALSEQRPEEPTSLRTDPVRDPFLVPVLEKLDQASLKQLSAILGAWPILPTDA